MNHQLHRFFVHHHHRSLPPHTWSDDKIKFSLHSHTKPPFTGSKNPSGCGGNSKGYYVFGTFFNEFSSFSQSNDSESHIFPQNATHPKRKYYLQLKKVICKIKWGNDFFSWNFFTTFFESISLVFQIFFTVWETVFLNIFQLKFLNSTSDFLFWAELRALWRYLVFSYWPEVLQRVSERYRTANKSERSLKGKREHCSESLAYPSRTSGQ